MDNKKRGSIEVFLPKDIFNSLVSVLEAFVAADETNKYADYAKRLKNKVMRYGRKFTNHGEEKIVIYFYEAEAAMLIKLLAIYVNAVGNSDEDFYSLVNAK